MATKIEFIQDGTKWACEMKPSASFVAQVQMADKKDFTVYAFIEGMKPIAVFASNLYDNLIFKVDVPSGVTVRMVAYSEVLDAQMIDVEQ